MRRTIAALLAVLMFATAIPMAAADDDSMKVIVCLENKEYALGTTGKVTVHVFDKGKHADPDATPKVTLGAYPTREVVVTKKTTGVYEGTFTLRSEDISYGYSSITATATIGKSNLNDTAYNEDTGYATIQLSGGTTGLEVRVYIKSISTGVVKAGTKVNVVAEVRHNGTAVVPSPFNFTLYYSKPAGSGQIVETIQHINPQTGVYECEYTIPDLAYSTDFSFRAQAKYLTSTTTGSVSVSLDHFFLMYHNISISGTETTFDLLVGDTAGKPVGNAHFDMGYYPDYGYSKMKWVDGGVTDAGGKKRITIAFDSGISSLYVSGYVNASGKSQKFYGTIKITTTAWTPQPDGNEFQAIYTGDRAVYTPGETINRDYILFNNSKVWANKEVFAYIAWGAFSTATYGYMFTDADGRVLTTDANGKLRLSITAPSVQNTFFNVEFESATAVHDKPDPYYGYGHDSVDGQFYAEDGDSFTATKTVTGKDITVTVSELKVGSPTTVKGSAKSTDPPVAKASWGLGSWTETSTEASDTHGWATWSSIDNFLTRSGSVYTGTILLPKFMPSGEKYTVVIYLDSPSLGSTYGAATMKPGQGTAPAAAFPWMVVGLVVAVVAVVLVVVVVMAMRRKPQPSYSGQYGQAPPQGAPAGPPGQLQYQQGPAPAQQPQMYAPPGAQPYPAPAPGPSPAPPQPGYGAPPQPVGYSAPQPGYGAPQPVHTQQLQMAQAPAPSPPQVPVAQPVMSWGPQLVTLPNNAMCGYCNQWLLAGSPGVLCSCGRYYHERCTALARQCAACQTKLA